MRSDELLTKTSTVASAAPAFTVRVLDAKAHYGFEKFFLHPSCWSDLKTTVAI